MWTFLWEIILLVLYFPVTMLFLFCGYMAEETVVTTAAEWFEYRFIGYTGPVLGLLTWPCLFLAIWLRRKGKGKAAAWLRVAPLLILTALFLISYLLRWIFG